MKKTCKICKVPKEMNRDNFYRKPRNADNYDTACIECRIFAARKRGYKTRTGWMNMFLGN